jgi:HemY protein
VKKKLVFVLLGLLLVVGGGAFLLHGLITRGDTGYVIIGYGRWALESSLLVMILLLAVAFIVLYLSVRLALHAWELPGRLRNRSSELRSRRSQEALIAGLIQSAEGNWETAERNLIRHAADSGLPLINYLTAARAAHFRGAPEQRDEYLKLAQDSVPQAELAVGLTRAELQLSNRQFNEALNSLTELNRLAPSHAAVLGLMHKVYAQMEDWEAVRRLLPDLHGNKVLMEAEIKLLETETYSALLKRKSESRDAAVLRELWGHIPAHIREVLGIQTLYYAAMIEAGAGEEIEEGLRLALGQHWDETLLVLYGCVKTADADRQLTQAEAWLAPHPRDAVLFRVLGKLALRAGQSEKARDYLQKSLDVEPSVEAYRLMGDFLFEQKDFVAAGHCYRSGLMLASREVVAQIEHHPAGADLEAAEA